MSTKVWEVQVKEVIDGDTFDGNILFDLVDVKDQRFRLLGINTPEKGEEGYYEAKELVAQMVEGKRVKVKVQQNKDSHGRWLAEVFTLSQGVWVNLNEFLLEEGLAKVYKPPQKNKAI